MSPSSRCPASSSSLTHSTSQGSKSAVAPLSSQSHTQTTCGTTFSQPADRRPALPFPATLVRHSPSCYPFPLSPLLSYKQQKFNLLREESEGYAKLAVELLTNMGPAHDPTTGETVESKSDRLARAKRVSEAVQSLIGKPFCRLCHRCLQLTCDWFAGNFDLDPDRTLDIVLDTFSSELLSHWQFFIDLLENSPWVPRPSSAIQADSGKGKTKEGAPQIGLEGDNGSRLVAQILGFKFAFYQTQEHDAPANLYLMAALLIWYGFVKLSEIWPHVGCLRAAPVSAIRKLNCSAFAAVAGRRHTGQDRGRVPR